MNTNFNFWCALNTASSIAIHSLKPSLTRKTSGPVLFGIVGSTVARKFDIVVLVGSPCACSYSLWSGLLALGSPLQEHNVEIIIMHICSEVVALMDIVTVSNPKYTLAK